MKKLIVSFVLLAALLCNLPNGVPSTEHRLAYDEGFPLGAPIYLAYDEGFPMLIAPSQQKIKTKYDPDITLFT